MGKRKAVQFVVLDERIGHEGAEHLSKVEARLQTVSAYEFNGDSIQLELTPEQIIRLAVIAWNMLRHNSDRVTYHHFSTVLAEHHSVHLHVRHALNWDRPLWGIQE